MSAVREGGNKNKKYIALLSQNALQLVSLRQCRKREVLAIHSIIV